MLSPFLPYQRAILRGHHNAHFDQIVAGGMPLLAPARSQKRVIKKTCFPIVSLPAQMQSVNVKTKKTFSPFNLKNTHVTIPRLRLHTRIHTHIHTHNHDVYMEQKHHKPQCHHNTLTKIVGIPISFRTLYLFTCPFVLKQHSYELFMTSFLHHHMNKTHAPTHTLNMHEPLYIFFVCFPVDLTERTHTYTLKNI